MCGRNPNVGAENEREKGDRRKLATLVTTGTPLDEFGETCSLDELRRFTSHGSPPHHDVSIRGADRPMPNVTADGHYLDKFRHGKVRMQRP